MIILQEYKEIPTKDIKVGKINEKDETLLQKVWAERKHIKKEGINKLFNVVKYTNGYVILNDRTKLLAAKSLGYDKVPCIVRDKKKERLINKMQDKLMLNEDEFAQITYVKI